ncbi:MULTISPECIES: hypothetical protein [unclassified Desulfobacter]|jgi:hypothetical protein|uniref:hypothetical protein n=1 Tax=unclassified Desulfobacter TaxID=2634406 RepID=UPI000E90705D|nr:MULTISPECIES: hypothetical protein [unclassified Desulfobacter]MDQ1271277.1 hypothetical protein [Thermodesulfobacteriota bacterium]MBP8828997.1 hypothetical protein [Desulfobacter sp.]MBP9597799.1 hypothetical protein [Desulfobacter sp.]HAR33844.1 hypothetical protein [Desulfobacter sp.]HBT88398.1 hypothetical protein [Desulfobacter sp.]
MDLSYICVNHNCSFPGANPFEVTFKSESIMDENNVASLFCPFCGNELMLVRVPDVFPENLPKDNTI